MKQNRRAVTTYTLSSEELEKKPIGAKCNINGGQNRRKVRYEWPGNKGKGKN
ncbi:hypothetical protein GCM10011389_01070 [Pontibacillus salipaludis]|uniref:Uncharacterized protein n=1 Tax=Pontibacillus salipaludis TaxID=1697394 RepID=A0ABQ1PIE2_9BACI|nr:hypothetical protein GCM10011389_01070 [Pontibacillus salipaludis]